MLTRLLVPSAFVLVLVACSSSTDPYAKDSSGTDPAAALPPAGGAGAKAASCADVIKGADPSKLAACTGTKGVKGRCVVRSGLGSFKDTFEQASCTADSACVPEDVVSKGSALELKKCKAVLDSDGRCFWALAKDIIDNYDLLKTATADQCAADQVCAPCVNPLTKESTKVCELGGSATSPACTPAASAPPAAPPAPGGGTPSGCPYTGTPIDTTSVKEENCGSNMACIGAALVGNPDLAKQLKPCSTGVCAPRKSIAALGNYVPKTCVSIASSEGRCSNIGIPAVGAQKDLLPVADCDADERCAPCFDPTTGTETGACSTVSCDKPAKPATKLAACCAGKATCVPKAAVPTSMQSSLGKDSCASSGDLCVPNDYVKDPNFQPKACSSSLPFIGGKGACVSTCLPAAFILSKDGCGPDTVCAPCSEMPAGTTVCNK